MIRMIMSAGAAAVLISLLVRGVTSTRRGILCWTFSSVSALAACVVYFAGAGNIRPDIFSLKNAFFGFLIIALIVMLLELFAPSRRFRKREDINYDKNAAENALNVVLAVTVTSAAFAAVLVELAGEYDFCILGLVPSAAISFRQLSYFMYRSRVDSLSENEDSSRRSMLLRSLSAGKRML